LLLVVMVAMRALKALKVKGDKVNIGGRSTVYLLSYLRNSNFLFFGASSNCQID